MTSYQFFLLLSCVFVASLASSKHSGADRMLLQTLDSSNKVGDEAGKLGDKFGAQDTAKKISEKIPRVGGVDHFQPLNQQYWAGIIATGLPGFLLAGLTFLVCFLFVLCRSCCNNCGGKNPRYDGYSKKQRFIPVLISLMFLAIAIVFCGLGFHNNEQFSEGFSGDNGITTVAPLVFSDVNGLIDQAKVPLHTLSVEVPNRVNQVVGILQGTAVLESGTNGLTDRLDTLARNMDGLTISAGSQTYECAFCNDVSTRVTTMSEEISSKSDPLFNKLSTVVNSVTDTLTEKSDIISQTINDSLSTAASAQDSINDVKGDVSDAMDIAETVDGHRKTAVTVLFIIPFLSLVLVLVAAFCKLGLLFRMNCCILFVLSLLMFLLFSFHLPMSLLLGDVCVYLDNAEKDMPSIIGTPQGDIVEACLNNVSLSEALNLTNQINFRDQIRFVDMPNLNASFNFSLFHTFVSEVNELDVTTFGFDSSEIDRRLFQFNNNLTLTSPGSPNFTRSDIHSADPNAYVGTLGPDARSAYKELIVTLVDTESAMNSTVDNIKHNVTMISHYTDELQQNVSRVDGEVRQIEPIIEPLFGIIDDFLSLANCGVLGVRYFEIKGALCDTIASSFIMLSLCFFMVGIVGLPLMILSIVLWKRIKTPRNKHGNIPGPKIETAPPQMMLMQPQQMQYQTVQMQPPMYQPQY